MTPDPYRNAYEKALADLTVLSDGFERLLNRKRQVDNLIAALQPIFSAPDQPSEPVAPSIGERPAAQSAEEQFVAVQARTADHEPRYSFLDVPAPLPKSDGDPFERRVRASLRFSGLAAQRSL